MKFAVDNAHALARGEQGAVLATPDFSPSLLDESFAEGLASGACTSADAPAVAVAGPRVGRLRFGEVEVETPAFMPVGTAASVKSLSPEDVWGIGYRLILANTYHLALRPGVELFEQLGSLHRFMAWPGAVLTDSGGFQVMSLAKLRKISEDGATFANHLNGAKLHFTPESVVQLQNTYGSDIQMVLDECPPHPSSREDVEAATERSMRWARRARTAFLAHPGRKSQFGIVQGGMHPDLRVRSARALQAIGFEGYAVGGLSVGESKGEMRRSLASVTPHLPAAQPRYLMGVGAPDDLIDGVLLGIDMFDCVMPTRNARNGSVFVRTAADPSGKLQIKNAAHRFSDAPLDPDCACLACRTVSRAYLRHLFIAEELAVHRYLTLHNLQFVWDLMAELRAALRTPSPWRAIAEIRACYVPVN